MFCYEFALLYNLSERPATLADCISPDITISATNAGDC